MPGDDKDEIDEELARLPAPKRRRNPLLAGAGIALALVIGWHARADVRYAFRGGTPVELGDARKATGLDDDTFGGFTDPNSGLVTPNSSGGFGGAIYVRNVTVDIIHLTFNDNVAFGGSGPSAGHAGSDIFADLGSAVTFEDTLFDDTNNFANPSMNPGSSELLDTAFAGGLLSAGYNLVHDGSWVNVTNWNPLNGDIGNGHQDLGPLQFNQAAPPGPTFTETYRLVTGPGEQAIGGGDDVGPQLDQNGRLRPIGLPSDIGSTQAF